MHALMSLPVVCGAVDLSEPLLMSGFLILMLAQISLHHVDLPLCIIDTNERKEGTTERVRQVEHATFVPAVMSASGGMGKAATALYRRVASLLAAKRGEQYSHVMAFIRCRIAVPLLRSCIMCLPGCRRLSSQSALAVGDTSAALAVVEARVPA